MIILKPLEGWGIELFQKIKSSLGIKYFIFIFTILIISSSTIYGIFLLFIPSSLHKIIIIDTQEELLKIADNMSRTGIDTDEIEKFSKKYNADIKLETQSGQIIQKVTSDRNDLSNEQTDAFVATANFIYDETSYVLYSLTTFKTTKQSTQALKKLLPYVLLASLFLAIIGAYLAYFFISKPIIKMSKISKKMARFNFDEKFTLRNHDELGQLGDNLNQLASNLSNALTDLQLTNQSLQEEVAKEKQRKQQQRDFFSAISHELKTPITVIYSTLEGMINNIGSYKDRDYYLLYTKDMVDALDQLVQEIMSISKLEIIENKLIMEPVDLSQITKTYISMNNKIAETKSIVVISLVNEGVIIQSDELSIQKVISNIINNSIRHSHKGAIVKVELSKTEDEATLIVTNSNSTIPEEDIPNLFQPFTRMEKSRNRDSGGSGLGLYIVKTILEKYDFSYSLKNSEEGVQFTVFFTKNSEKG